MFGDAVWKIRGEAKTGREIYFALYQTLADSGEALGVFRDYPPDYFDLIVVDECHRGSARDGSDWHTILEHFSPATQIGMTATPKREANIDTYRYFGDSLYTHSLAQGIADGFLAPYRVRRVVLSPDAQGWSPEPGQLDRFGREIPEGLYETRHFERVVSLLTRTDAAARHLSEYLRSTDPMAKTIVFCVDSDHAAQMRQALNNENADLARRHPDYVVRIVSDEGDTGREYLGDFADPERETPVIATTAQLLSTGVDMPTVRNIVLFKPIGSIVEFKQIIGRGSRLYPDEDKLTFEIIDYSGATALFADPEFDGPPEAPPLEEEIDQAGNAVVITEVAEPEPAYGEPGDGAVDADELEDMGVRKFYVDDGPAAYVTAEGFYLPDPQRALEARRVQRLPRRRGATPVPISPRAARRVGHQAWPRGGHGGPCGSRHIAGRGSRSPGAQPHGRCGSPRTRRVERADDHEGPASAAPERRAPPVLRGLRAGGASGARGSAGQVRRARHLSARRPTSATPTPRRSSTLTGATG